MDAGRVGKLFFSALISVLALTAQPAFALGIRNCTDIDIRVNVYKDKDPVKLIPMRGGKASIGRGKFHNFRIGKRRHQIRVFGSKKLTLPLLDKSGLRGGANYSIRGRNGHYSLSSENGCPPQDRVALPAAGVWAAKRDGKDVYIRVEGRSPTSFAVTYLPDGATHVFDHDTAGSFTSLTASFDVHSARRMVRIDHLILGRQEAYTFVRR